LKKAPRSITSEGVSTSPWSRQLGCSTTSLEASMLPTTAPCTTTVRARMRASTAASASTTTVSLLSMAPRNSPSMRIDLSRTSVPSNSQPRWMKVVNAAPAAGFSSG
jgi:hypothetical protein